jgi:hypothetical protein
MLSQPDQQADGRPWPSRMQVAAGADVVNAVSGGQAGRAAVVDPVRLKAQDH